MNNLEPFKRAIIVQAQAEAPSECCGLLLHSGTISRQIVVHPCRNSAPDPRSGFIIPVEESWNLRERVYGFYHSHVTDPAVLSPADKTCSEEAQLPLLVYSLLDSQFNWHFPSGFRAPLIGRAFILGIQDCVSLVRDYYSQVLKISLPDPERDLGDLIAGKKFSAEFLTGAGFDLLLPSQPVKAHDVVLMSCNTSSGKPNHLGVINAEGLLLHQLIHRMSCVVPYSGYYKANTVLILRHHATS